MEEMDSGAGECERNPGLSELKPNVFFYALIVGGRDYELNIFNSGVELLFVSTDQDIGWTGY